MGLLNIHALERMGVCSLGPGLRYVVWVQGCPFHCAGCATPEARPLEANSIYSVETIADDIISSGCDGLTISGGEPFLQADGLLELLEIVHGKKPQITVIIFTGFLRQDLQSQSALKLLAHTDLLIDGPFVERLNDGIGLRGSSNQQCHFLTGRLLPWKEEIEKGKRSVEICFHKGMMESIGIPLKHK